MTALVPYIGLIVSLLFAIAFIIALRDLNRAK
jgi:hypothetical protein